MRRGLALECTTLTWNVVGLIVLAIATIAGRSVDDRGPVTMIDGILAAAVLAGLALNAGFGWWWADPAAGYALVFCAAREVREIF